MDHAMKEQKGEMVEMSVQRERSPREGYPEGNRAAKIKYRFRRP